jgi:arylsulfatase A-like enzyme
MTGKKRPNIVIFNPDQWRGDVLGHMGNPAAVTPNLDALVGTDAVSFRNAFCQNPVCTPSRCSFMSGWYPHVRGHRTMNHMMRPGEPVLLKELKDAGYFVWWGGKNDLVPAEGGFEAYCDVKYAPDEPITPGADLHASDGWRGGPEGDNYYSFFAGKCPEPEDGETFADRDWLMVRGAADFIGNAPADRPFCVYLPLSYPHPPYGVEPPYFEIIDRTVLPPRIPAPDWEGKPSILRGIWERQGIKDWDEARFTELRAVYYGMCARVDAQLGLLAEALRKNGLWDDTALFFFSDHGDFTGDYSLVEKTQNTFEDCLTRVPFVVKPPAGLDVKPGIRDALVELIDFTATARSWAGLAHACTQFGRPLDAVLRGETDEARDAVFAEGGRLRGETHCMEQEALPDPPERFLYYPRLILQGLETGEHGKAAMCRTKEWKYVMRLYEEDELYDLKRDPCETANRIGDPACADVLGRMKERLLRFFMETGDVVPFDLNRR